MEEESSILVLNDEYGNEIRFEYLDAIEYKGDEYLVLMPEDEESGEIYILLVEPTDDPELENYVGVGDEATLDAVYAIFKEKWKHILNFAD